MRIDSRTGKSTGNPRKLTNWAGFCLDAMSVTGDSRKLAFVESVDQANVYLADVQANGAHVGNVRLLTPSLGFNQASAWSADGQAVIVRSNREGRWRIYKQPLDGKTAEPLVTEPEEANAFQARVLGPWVIYEIRPKDSTCTTPVSVMRVPLAGGPPEQLLKAPILELRCGRVSCMAITCS